MKRLFQWKCIELYDLLPAFGRAVQCGTRRLHVKQDRFFNIQKTKHQTEEKTFIFVYYSVSVEEVLCVFV